MKLVVADASALAEYLLRTTRGEEVGETLRDEKTDLHVPALCDLEVTAVLRRGLRSDGLGSERARQALEDYRDLPLVRHEHLALPGRALALRESFSVYDAAYVVLAEGLAAALLTADDRLARAARDHTEVPVLPS